jgi:hypothetical protein
MAPDLARWARNSALRIRCTLRSGAMPSCWPIALTYLPRCGPPAPASVVRLSQSTCHHAGTSLQQPLIRVEGARDSERPRVCHRAITCADEKPSVRGVRWQHASMMACCRAETAMRWYAIMLAPGGRSDPFPAYIPHAVGPGVRRPLRAIMMARDVTSIDGHHAIASADGAETSPAEARLYEGVTPTVQPRYRASAARPLGAACGASMMAHSAEFRAGPGELRRGRRRSLAGSQPAS